MNDEVVITVDNVYKDFILVHEKKGTIKGVFTSMFRKVTVKKETQHALKDISFEIKKGEFFGIVGRNGSGKSTMLKILAGIYQPTKGSISTKGKLVPFIELGVGFNPELSGKDNVYLNGAVLGFSAKEVDDMYDDIVGFAELERFMDQKLKNYSSGMQVRLAFSMATRAKADILLIDEVLAVGDADFQRKCFDYFKTLKKDKKTVVFVSHDMSAVREYCDRVAFIEDSVLVAVGKANAIASKYTQLFMSENVDNNEGAGERWGDGKIITSKVEVSVMENYIEIIQHVQAKRDTENPIIGIRVRDSAGVEVLGTNTKVEKTKIGLMRSGESRIVNWQIPNILSDGRYVLDSAILHEDSITVADWWDDAKKFRVAKERHLPYPIDPGFKLDIEAAK